jgi:truncated hemoglobin YjbI
VVAAPIHRGACDRQEIVAVLEWQMRVLADKWLAHFRDALNIAVADVDARRVIYEKVRALGLALVNESEPHTKGRSRVRRGASASRRAGR